MNNNLITFMIFLPLVGALGQIFIPGIWTETLSKNWSKGKFSRWIALIASALSSACGLMLVFLIKSGGPGFSIAELHPWVGSYSISYSVEINGLNVLLVLLISIVFPILVFSEWSTKKGIQGIQGLFLLLQTSLYGMVCAQDLFLLFFFWALSTLPFYFLISIWGGEFREKAALRYIVTGALGNALLFIALILIYYASEPHTFAMEELLGGQVSKESFSFLGYEVSVLSLGFMFLCLGMAFRVPVWPIHGWFSYFATQAPPSVLVAICGVFIPVAMSVFGKLSYSLFPQQVAQYAGVIMFLGVLNVVFGMLCAVIQRELKLLLAFLCIGQVGMILIGIGSLDSSGVVGAAYQQLSFGLGLAGLGLFSGLVSTRMGESVFIDSKGKRTIGGIASYAPMMALVVGLLVASLLGMPGLGGFIGQSLIMMGGFAVSPLSIGVTGVGVLLMTFGLFSMYRYVFLGSPSQKAQGFSDLSFVEKSYLFPLVGVLVFLGIYPKPLLDMVRPSVLALLEIVR